MSERSSYEGVIVFGFPRSGTTMLRRLIDAHPALCCPPEPYVTTACARFLAADEIVNGLQLGIEGGLAFSGIKSETILDGLRQFAFGLMKQISDKAGKQHWVERTPLSMFHIDAIERLCGDRFRYICLVRHPLDVVYSTKELTDELEIFPSDLHEYVRRFPAPLEAFAHSWVDVHQRLLRFMQEHQRTSLQIRYEDLVDDCPRELERMCEFLAVPTDTKALVDRAMAQRERVGIGDWKTYEKKEISRGSIGRWRKLSEHRVGRLAAIVDPILPRFGYPQVQVEVAVDPERARHQYEVGMWVRGLKGHVGRGGK